MLTPQDRSYINRACEASKGRFIILMAIEIAAILIITSIEFRCQDKITYVQSGGMLEQVNSTRHTARVFTKWGQISIPYHAGMEKGS